RQIPMYRHDSSVYTMGDVVAINLGKSTSMKVKMLVSAAAVCGCLSGCADHADKVQASYVSPLQYQEYSCHQIRAEVMRITHKLNEVAGVQDKTASNDSAAMGVGLILFWPALFFIDH